MLSKNSSSSSSSTSSREARAQQEGLRLSATTLGYQKLAEQKRLEEVQGKLQKVAIIFNNNLHTVARKELDKIVGKNREFQKIDDLPEALLRILPDELRGRRKTPNAVASDEIAAALRNSESKERVDEALLLLEGAGESKRFNEAQLQLRTDLIMKLYKEGKHSDVQNLVDAVSVKELLPHLQRVFEEPFDSGPNEDDDGSDFGGSDDGSVLSFGEGEDADDDGQSDDEDGLLEKQKRYIYVNDDSLDQFSDIEQVNNELDPNSDQYQFSEDDIYGTDHAEPLATAAASSSCSTFSTSSKAHGCPNTPTVCKSWPRCRCLRCIEGRGCCYVCRYYYKCDCGHCGFANGAGGDDNRIVGDHIVALLDDEMLRWQGRGGWTARYEYVKERVEGI